MTLMVLQKSFRRPAKSLKFLTEVLLKNNAGFKLSTKSGLNSYFACKMVVLKLSYCYNACKMVNGELLYSAGKRQASAEWLKKSRFKLMKRLFLYSTIQY